MSQGSGTYRQGSAVLAAGPAVIAAGHVVGVAGQARFGLDVGHGRGDTRSMFVPPIPRHGDVVVGRDVAGRVLRVSAHPENNRLVLSIWQGGRCLATVRLAPEDVPFLVGVLSGEAVRDDQPKAVAG